MCPRKQREQQYLKMSGTGVDENTKPGKLDTGLAAATSVKMTENVEQLCTNKNNEVTFNEFGNL